MSQLARLCYLSLIVLLAAVGLFLFEQQQQNEQFERARLFLLEGAYGQAEKAFRELREAWFVGDTAAVGERLSGALSGRPSQPEPLSSKQWSKEDFPLQLLFTQALQQRNFHGLLELSREVAGHPSSHLFQIAALLELGRREEAQSLWSGPSLAGPQWLAARISPVLDLPEGVQQIIRDRRGRLLAWRDADGRIALSRGSDRQLSALLREIPNHGRSWLVAAALPSFPAALEEQVSADERPVVYRTSLDLDLMRVARDALQGYRGTIVLLAPATGEVLAAVSDQRTAKEPLPAFHQRREPASIAKLITTSAALRWDLDPDQILAQDRCDGAKRYQGGILYCAYRAGRLRGLDRSMAISCNIGFADLAIAVGRSRLLQEYRLFGFDSGADFGHILSPRGNQRQLADLGIGLEATDITPLHAALLAATVANGGRMATPVLVSASDGLLGASPRFRGPGDSRTVLSPAHDAILKRAMRAVVREGTGQDMAEPGFPVAMKTGTGRDPGKGGYHVNYIGFGPVDHPSIAFSVRVTHQRNSLRVRRAGVAVTRKLLAALAHLQESGGWPYSPATLQIPSPAFLAPLRASR